MFNILSKSITPLEKLLLRRLEPRGADLLVPPSEIFSQDYISCVIEAFNEGKFFLDAGSLRKAVKFSKLKLAKLLADLGDGIPKNTEVNHDENE